MERRSRIAVRRGLAIATAFGLAWSALAPAQEPSAWSTATGAPGPEADVPRVASYRLQARLEADTHRVEGDGTITLHNRSSEPLQEIYLHLYLNAFKNSESLFARSPFKTGRSGDPPEHHGYCQVHELRVGEHDLWPAREYVVPDDETDVRVPLPEPLLPGEVLELRVRFSSQLPGIVERTGFSKDYHLVAQWFPKLARLRPDGTWAHFAFDPQAEFHADFGDYDVELDVPREYVVGATGRLAHEVVNGERKRLRYLASPVHDFAWTAWPRFRVHERQIAGVQVRVLHPEGHQHNVERTFAAIEFGLPHYQERYGRYPYSTLTVVHPPRHGRHSGGMEYPGFITTGGNWYAPWLGRSVELVTLHELAHQWFYGIVASNEARDPFLDEGLASYAELVAIEEWLGAGGVVDFLGLGVSLEALHRLAAARVAGDQPIATAAADFASFRELGGLAYSRTAMVLRTLANVYGQEAMRATLAAYAREQRFRHPEPAALLDAIGRGLGPEARQRAETALFERATVDYRVAALNSEPLAGRSGYFGEGDPELVMESASPGGYQNRVSIQRRGALSFPVTVRLWRADGTQGKQRWDGSGDFAALVETHASPLLAARVDPELHVPLDHDLSNNAQTLDEGSTVELRSVVVFAAQWLLGFLGP